MEKLNFVDIEPNEDINDVNNENVNKVEQASLDLGVNHLNNMIDIIDQKITKIVNEIDDNTLNIKNFRNEYSDLITEKNILKKERDLLIQNN